MALGPILEWILNPGGRLTTWWPFLTAYHTWGLPVPKTSPLEVWATTPSCPRCPTGILHPSSPPHRSPPGTSPVGVDGLGVVFGVQLLR